jgi:hypothetical protein
MGNLLNIYDNVLLRKVIDFIYVYSVPNRPCSPRYLPNLPIILNQEEQSSWDIIQEHIGIDKLRGVSKEYKDEDTLTAEEIEECINLFLIHMCSGSKEASLGLDNLLNKIVALGERGFGLQSVNRLIGILAATILVYYCPNKSQENKPSEDMRHIFAQNSNYYTPNDKDYLITIFWQHNEYDCLIYLLQTLINNRNGKQAYKQFIDAFVRICEMYRKGIYSNRYKGRAKDGEIFIRKCEELFESFPNEKKLWYIELANNLFNQHKYEEAKIIWDESIEDNTGDLSILYNSSIFYAWAAERKEKNGIEWNQYIQKAINYIDKGIASLPRYNENENTKIKGYRISFYLEKSFLLSEQDNYNEAYDWLKKAYKIDNSHIAMEDSNYDTHFWIISQHLKNNPNECSTIIPKTIKLISERFHNLPTDYYTIFNFIINDTFLKENEEYQNKVCECLLIALLNAQEIKHISKIRDPAQYDIVYYTKLSNLRLLFEDEKDCSTQYRIPLFHAYHMNDPQEGRILYNFLNNTSESTSKTPGRFTYEENYVFLKSCFSYPKKDGESHLREFLPMWVQYGDEAKGCCVVLNSKTFDECTLRRITYLSDEWKCDNGKMNILLEDFREAYNKTEKICKEIQENTSKEIHQNAEKCTLEIQSILKYIVSQIAYLFKHDSYKHENEVRLIKTLSESSLTETKHIPGEIPKTYIYNNSQTFIDEIILGSKVNNPENYIPFFCIHGRKMWKGHSKDQIKITHSAIQYR